MLWLPSYRELRRTIGKRIALLSACWEQRISFLNHIHTPLSSRLIVLDYPLPKIEKVSPRNSSTFEGGFAQMSEPRMQETPEYKPGTFCWVELGTSDSAAAKTFYTQLFGWEYQDHPMGPGMTYTMLKLNGQDVGALYELMPEMKAQGVPPHWLSYVAVNNADETAEKAKAQGATLMKEPFDVMTEGRMAVIQDPTGAVFAIWQAMNHKGSAARMVPNSACWNELGTNDTKKAGEFYSNVFGWGQEGFPGSPIEYTVFKNGADGAGGMYQITPEMGPIPPHWLVYFAVEDCDAKVQKATELGASIMKPAEDIPGVGRFAILLDPQRAAFALLKPQPHQ
jgi:predicted enzyme related to lactoylglutathione lyase